MLRCLIHLLLLLLLNNVRYLGLKAFETLPYSILWIRRERKQLFYHYQLHIKGSVGVLGGIYGLAIPSCMVITCATRCVSKYCFAVYCWLLNGLVVVMI